jgi:hypothetical protein
MKKKNGASRHRELGAQCPLPQNPFEVETEREEEFCVAPNGYDVLTVAWAGTVINDISTREIAMRLSVSGLFNSDQPFLCELANAEIMYRDLPVIQRNWMARAVTIALAHYTFGKRHR